MEIKNNNLIVSVGIPVVKSTYLSSAIESCLNQSYNNLEVIILNNASTKERGDEIEAIVDKYSDNRLKYYRNTEQLPMIENWNKVLGYATGDLFSLLCDDDQWESDFILKMVVLSNKYPATNLLHSRVLLIKDGGNNKTSLLSPLCNEYEDSLDFIYHRIRGFRFQYLSDFMVRLSVIKKIGGFVYLPDGWGSDDITWFKVAAAGDGVAYDSNPLFIYRDHEENITNSKGMSNKLESIKLYERYVNSLVLNIGIYNDLEEIKKNAILEELKTYKERKTLDLIHKSLLNNSAVPNLFLPYIMVFYKTYRHLKILVNSKINIVSDKT